MRIFWLLISKLLWSAPVLTALTFGAKAVHELKSEVSGGDGVSGTAILSFLGGYPLALTVYTAALALLGTSLSYLAPTFAYFSGTPRKAESAVWDLYRTALVERNVIDETPPASKSRWGFFAKLRSSFQATTEYDDDSRDDALSLARSTRILAKAQRVASEKAVSEEWNRRGLEMRAAAALSGFTLALLALAAQPAVWG